MYGKKVILEKQLNKERKKTFRDIHPNGQKGNNSWMLFQYELKRALHWRAMEPKISNQRLIPPRSLHMRIQINTCKQPPARDNYASVLYLTGWKLRIVHISQLNYCLALIYLFKLPGEQMAIANTYHYMPFGTSCSSQTSWKHFLSVQQTITIKKIKCH